MEPRDIGSTVEEKRVTDMDVTFTNGFMMSVTIDESLGDYMIQSGNTLRVFNVERPSAIDPSNKVPAEETIINLANVLAMQKRERVITDATPEQKAEWAEMLRELSTSQGN